MLKETVYNEAGKVIGYWIGESGRKIWQAICPKCGQEYNNVHKCSVAATQPVGEKKIFRPIIALNYDYDIDILEHLLQHLQSILHAMGHTGLTYLGVHDVNSIKEKED